MDSKDNIDNTPQGSIGMLDLTATYEESIELALRSKCFEDRLFDK
jgi:hypothetical protein